MSSLYCTCLPVSQNQVGQLVSVSTQPGAHIRRATGSATIVEVSISTQPPCDRSPVVLFALIPHHGVDPRVTLISLKGAQASQKALQQPHLKCGPYTAGLVLVGWGRTRPVMCHCIHTFLSRCRNHLATGMSTTLFANCICGINFETSRQGRADFLKGVTSPFVSTPNVRGRWRVSGRREHPLPHSIWNTSSPFGEKRADILKAPLDVTVELIAMHCSLRLSYSVS